MISASTHGFFASSGGGSAYDTDAQAFFTANSTLTDATTKTAINQFVLDLKSNSLWSLGKYLYLGFLGNSTKCGYNLFNPSNSLIWSSGWTFDSYGMTGNGSSTYARTGFIANTSATQDSKTLLSYNQSNIDQLGMEIGAVGNVGSYRDWLMCKYDNQIYAPLSHTLYQTKVNLDSRGLISASRTASNLVTFYKNGSSIGTDTQSSSGQPNLEDYIGCMNNVGSTAWFSSKKITLLGRMDGMNSTQMANLNTCINTLLTSLSIPTW